MQHQQNSIHRIKTFINFQKQAKLFHGGSSQNNFQPWEGQVVIRGAQRPAQEMLAMLNSLTCMLLRFDGSPGENLLGCAYTSCSQIACYISIKSSNKSRIFSFVFNLIQKSHHQSIFIIKISYVQGWQSLFFSSLYLVKMSYTVLLILIITMYYLGVQKSGRSLTFQNQIISLIFHRENYC